MNSSYIKACVACYFRYKRQCVIVSFERPINNYLSKPDVFAVDKSRRLIEVEVKITMADFRNDIKKRIWNYRERLSDLYPMPYQFYCSSRRKPCCFSAGMNSSILLNTFFNFSYYTSI